MAIYTSKVAYTFPPMNDKPSLAPYMTLPPLDMLGTSGPKPYWRETSGGRASPHLSTLSSLDAQYANRTKSITILLAPHLLPSLHLHSYLSNSSWLTWLWIFLLLVDMTH